MFDKKKAIAIKAELDAITDVSVKGVGLKLSDLRKRYDKLSTGYQLEEGRELGKKLKEKEKEYEAYHLEKESDNEREHIYKSGGYEQYYYGPGMQGATPYLVRLFWKAFFEDKKIWGVDLLSCFDDDVGSIKQSLMYSCLRVSNFSTDNLGFGFDELSNPVIRTLKHLITHKESRDKISVRNWASLWNMGVDYAKKNNLLELPEERAKRFWRIVEPEVIQFDMSAWCGDPVEFQRLLSTKLFPLLKD